MCGFPCLPHLKETPNHRHQSEANCRRPRSTVNSKWHKCWFVTDSKRTFTRPSTCKPTVVNVGNWPHACIVHSDCIASLTLIDLQSLAHLSKLSAGRSFAYWPNTSSLYSHCYAKQLLLPRQSGPLYTTDVVWISEEAGSLPHPQPMLPRRAHQCIVMCD